MPSVTTHSVRDACNNFQLLQSKTLSFILLSCGSQKPRAVFRLLYYNIYGVIQQFEY